MAGFLMEKQPGRLRPVDQEGIDALAKIKDGKILFVDPKLTRNPKQHRLFWALVSLIHQHQDRYATREQVSNALKIAVGYYDEQPLVKGGFTMLPKSIAYHNMAQDEFQQFFEKVVDLVIEQILPRTKKEDLKAELESMVGLRR